jgi:signal transduction histidine kinase
MNKSFKKQIFFSLMLLVLVLFIVLNFSSRQLLERYYVNKRKDQMENISQRIEKTDGPLRVELLTSSIEERLGGDIIIFDGNQEVVFSSKSRLSTRRIENNDLLLDQIQRVTNQPQEMYYITRQNNEDISTQLIGLYKTQDQQIIMTQIPLEAIETTLEAIRRFLLMVSGVFLIISLFIANYISNRIAKPLVELSQKTKKLTTFNFSENFKTTRKDEIGDLFRDIQLLSLALQEKIQALENSNVLLKNEMKTKDILINQRKTFIANISHELKTPLALIQAYSEGLIDKTFSNQADADYYLKVIRDETKHMDYLIKDLIDLMQLELKDKAFKREEENLKNLVKKAINPFKETFDQRNIVLKEEILDIHVMVDSSQIIMALRNLISNAIDHVSDKGVVLIKSQIEDNLLRISVFNTGEGIPSEDLEEIWEAFYKVDKSRNRQFGGSGIGLSIVKEVFENHGFEYGVKNLRNGVSFYFYIPKDYFKEN